MREWIGIFGALGLIVGCGDSGPPEAVCSVTNETIDGTQWVMWEAMHKAPNRENTMARMQFYKEGDAQKARYTVKSLSDAYVYDCEPQYAKGKEDQGMKEWFCREETHLRDWCQSLEVYKEGSCTAEKLKEFGAVGTPKEFEDAIKLAKETTAKYRNTPKWNQFYFNNNNLGNKLQGLFYAKMKKVRKKQKEKRCQISVTDNYMTIFNGKRVQDSNPVGTNPFIQTTDKFEYEHCLDPRALLDSNSATLPEDMSTYPRKRIYEAGQTVYYHFIGEKEAKAVEGCTYSRDIHAQWRPVKTGEEVAVAENGTIQWNMSHEWNNMNETKLVNENIPVGVLKMVRYKTCGGEQEKIDVLCTPTRLLVSPDEEPSE